MSVLVSVVVPTCRRPDLLERCLRALLAQDFNPSAYEILVVDDAAEEETACLVKKLAEQSKVYELVGGSKIREPALVSAQKEAEMYAMRAFEEEFEILPGPPRLRYLPAGHTQGPAAARNLGWQAARGEVIAFTDDDCIPSASWLKNGLEAFEGGVVGVSGQIVVPIPAWPTDYEKNVGALVRSQFVTANCFYALSVLQEVGGFDERFKLAWREDSDLYFRIVKGGYSLAYAPDALVIHPVRAAPWGVSLGQQRKSMYNALVFKKHPRLYRERLQPAPPWRYYAILGAVLVLLSGLLSGAGSITSLSGLLWFGLTANFCARRLRGTARTSNHIIEMILTSVLIPFLSVYWRLRGALKFRVFFF